MQKITVFLLCFLISVAIGVVTWSLIRTDTVLDLGTFDSTNPERTSFSNRNCGTKLAYTQPRTFLNVMNGTESARWGGCGADDCLKDPRQRVDRYVRWSKCINPGGPCARLNWTHDAADRAGEGYALQGICPYLCDTLPGCEAVVVNMVPEEGNPESKWWCEFRGDRIVDPENTEGIACIMGK